MNINQNPASSQTQTQRILAYMLAGNRITPLEALEKFSSFRLGARIADIKELGYDVQSRFVTTKSDKRVKQYWLETSTL